MIARIGPVIGAAAIGDVPVECLPQRPDPGREHRRHQRLLGRTWPAAHSPGRPGEGTFLNGRHRPVPGRRPRSPTRRRRSASTGRTGRRWCGSATTGSRSSGSWIRCRSPPSSTGRRCRTSRRPAAAARRRQAGAGLRPHQPRQRPGCGSGAGSDGRPERAAGCYGEPTRPTRSRRGPMRRPLSRACSSRSARWRCCVGGIGIANVMVIAVLERRNEIGLRRALGASRRHIALQFAAEAVVLAGAGGAAGAALGGHRHGGVRCSQALACCRPAAEPGRRDGRRAGGRRRGRALSRRSARLSCHPRRRCASPSGRRLPISPPEPLSGPLRPRLL